jgi:hypothetical protein
MAIANFKLFIGFSISPLVAGSLTEFALRENA